VYSFVANELLKIASYVDKQMFWKAQIEQIFVTRDNEFILIPKIGNHKILLGDANDLEIKFDKLFVFYKEGLSRVGWNKYATIDIRFDKQVVCK
jgi:cell division protein FtsQ